MGYLKLGAGNRKNLYIFVCIISLVLLFIPTLIFLADDYLRRDFENPFKVAKAFALSYMTKDVRNMKGWSVQKTHERIDRLGYSAPIDIGQIMSEGDFELALLQRLDTTIVCSYVCSFFEGTPLVYTVVVQPAGPDSLWEKFKWFVSLKIPFGDKLVGVNYSKRRWSVVDFFTDDDAEKQLDVYRNRWLENPEMRVEALMRDPSKIVEEIDRRVDYEIKWGNTAKILQNAEAKKLYRDYLRIIDSNN